MGENSKENDGALPGGNSEEIYGIISRITLGEFPKMIRGVISREVSEAMHVQTLEKMILKILGEIAKRMS